MSPGTVEASRGSVGRPGTAGALRRSALLLAAALVVSSRRRRVLETGSRDGSEIVGLPTFDSPTACRDALASLLDADAERVRFGWADATLPVCGFEVANPVLDGDWLLDSDGVRARNDWRFTILTSTEELAAWTAQGLAALSEDRSPILAPRHLERFREATPLWHGLVVDFEIDTAAAEYGARSPTGLQS